MSRVLDTQRWQRVRRKQLAIEPMCRRCAELGREMLAVDVDHIVPRSRGGAVFSLDNLQSLCVPCHSQKTGRYDLPGRDWTLRDQPLCDADGYPIDPSHPWAQSTRQGQ